MSNNYYHKGSLLFNTKQILSSNLIKETLTKYKIFNKSILILDDTSSHLLSKYMSMSEVISLGIYNVESIYKSRKEYKHYDAIYLITGEKDMTRLLRLRLRSLKLKYL